MFYLIIDMHNLRNTAPDKDKQETIGSNTSPNEMRAPVQCVTFKREMRFLCNPDLR